MARLAEEMATLDGKASIPRVGGEYCTPLSSADVEQSCGYISEL
jgi:hypothetical protein